ncbi:P49 [Spodoptera littoralis nucleopolyhedrovirus]|uniref:Apoptotic suppressor protein n=1 Tax=Spodoptera littoralis nuclear polyhedrosis virus TaxID=10456 RepID=Q9YQQ7_NPVSL|nr:P49 [Spodoptera littoralis nucleopolyhedrovirus]AGE89906.1 P49 [Spodoptera littoralis nucleopolyhedrovirus]AYU75241.1 P49 poptotic suppressor protein [Spodoptera littoralis nucleopolyhedrovirus]CAA07223.1 apoptotic suppressor protein [Spodoptera littoralis nucleopolyhedrovirus]
MCVLIPTFNASATTIVDCANLSDSSMRDLIYVNNVAVSKNGNYINRAVIMALNISGPLVCVNRVSMHIVHMYRSHIDRVFDKFNKLTYSATVTDGGGADRVFNSDDYTVVCMSRGDLLNNYKNCLLNEMGATYDDVEKFRKYCLKPLTETENDMMSGSDVGVEDQKKPYVVICSLKPKLLNNKKTLCFTYKPQTGQVIVPLMHEINENGSDVYAYEVMAMIKDVRLSNKPIGVLERLKRSMEQIVLNHNENRYVMTNQLESLNYYLKSINSNKEDNDLNKLMSLLKSLIDQLEKVLHKKSICDFSDDEDDCDVLVDVKYHNAMIEDNIRILLIKMQQYIDDRHMFLPPSLSYENSTKIRLFENVTSFMKCFSLGELYSFVKKIIDWKTHETNQKLACPEVVDDKYAFVKYDYFGTAHGFVYDQRDRTMYVKLHCGIAANRNIYIDI